jgi:hypothetical protein
LTDESVTIPVSELVGEITESLRLGLAAQMLVIIHRPNDELALYFGERVRVVFLSDDDQNAFIRSVARNLAQRWITRL